MCPHQEQLFTESRLEDAAITKRCPNAETNRIENSTVTVLNQRVDLHPAPGGILGSASGCAHAPAAFSGARVWQIEDTWLSPPCKPTSRCSPGVSGVEGGGRTSAFESGQKKKSGCWRRGLCALIPGRRTDVLAGMCLGMMVSVR